MRVYTTKDVLEKLRISRNTLLNWFKQGKTKDVEKRDRNGYRIFTEYDLRRLSEYKNKTIVNAGWKTAKKKKAGIIKRVFFMSAVFLFFSSVQPVLCALTGEIVEVKSCEVNASEVKESFDFRDGIIKKIRSEFESDKTKQTRVFSVRNEKNGNAGENDFNGTDSEEQDFQEVLAEDVEKLFSKYERTDSQPIADALSDVEEGVIPFTVNFNGLGLDNDGEIAMYKWNFLGKGREMCSSRESGDSVYVYRQAGLFTPVFSVVNDKGYTDTYCMLVNARTGDNAPGIKASADTYDGIAPLEVGFSAAASSEHGKIIRYEWDFDGDGIYDWSSEYSPMVKHRYTRGGIYPATIRVTDNMALMTVSVIYISVAPADNAPSITARADVDSGTCPLKVVFDALADGSTDIIKYEWDFDGDGLFDWESEHTSFSEHVYKKPGVYSAKIKITGDNLLSAVDVIEVRAEKNPDKLYPISDFEMSISEGQVPLEVCFMELALEGDEDIIEYEWDFDGDGRWDETLSGNADTDYVYDEVGLFRAVLKVTDKEGLSDEASKFITVTDAIAPVLTETKSPEEKEILPRQGPEPQQEQEQRERDFYVTDEEASEVSETSEPAEINKTLCPEAEKIKNRIISAIIKWLESFCDKRVDP